MLTRLRVSAVWGCWPVGAAGLGTPGSTGGMFPGQRMGFPLHTRPSGTQPTDTPAPTGADRAGQELGA